MNDTRRDDHLLNSDLLRRIVLETSEDDYDAAVTRGGVRDYDQRYIKIGRHPEGYRNGTSYQLLKALPRDLNPLITLLTELRHALATEDLRIPSCVYCGDDVESIEDAEQHFADNHTNRTPTGEYQREWYEPDPNGNLASIVEDISLEPEARDYLRFHDDFVVPVIEGEKTATVRYDLEGVSVGDVLRATTPDGSKFADIRVTRTADVMSVEAHDIIQTVGANYPSEKPQDVIDALNDHYDGIAPSTTVTVVVFEVVDDGP